MKGKGPNRKLEYISQELSQKVTASLLSEAHRSRAMNDLKFSLSPVRRKELEDKNKSRRKLEQENIDALILQFQNTKKSVMDERDISSVKPAMKSRHDRFHRQVLTPHVNMTKEVIGLFQGKAERALLKQTMQANDEYYEIKKVCTVL